MLRACGSSKAACGQEGLHEPCMQRRCRSSVKPALVQRCHSDTVCRGVEPGFHPPIAFLPCALQDYYELGVILTRKKLYTQVTAFG